jgi:hypothetical protein
MRPPAFYKLMITHDELKPIAEGSNLPRLPDEPPLEEVTDEEVLVLGGIAEQLTAIYQDRSLRWGTHSVAIGSAKHNIIQVPDDYEGETAYMLGAWARRYAHHLEQGHAKEDIFQNAARIALDMHDIVRTTQGATDIRVIDVLPWDPRFQSK